jgi:hypothetical protein
MEKIQERALRFIYNDYVLNYEELLERSKMPSLKDRRLRQSITRQTVYTQALQWHEPPFQVFNNFEN